MDFFRPRDSARRSHLIRIDVVVLAIASRSHAGYHRNRAAFPDGVDPLGIAGTDLADKSQVAMYRGLLASAECEAIAAAHPHRSLSLGADCSD